MDLDALLYHYFETTDLDTLDAGALERGVERLGTAFWSERDAGRRFALWALLDSLGEGPDPDTAFKDRRERDAAIAWQRAAGQVERS